LVGLNDDDLLALAPLRKASLLDALEASSDARHAMAVAKLVSWRARAGGGPFAFYASLLGADRGRHDIEARLGAEACDGVDEFLRLALAHEETNVPSLSAFLNSLARLEHSVKRDMESGEDLVRVMTVHAAKGLEAKIVFLPDTCSVPSARHDPKIFLLDTKVPGEQAIVWSPKKDLDCDLVALARKKMRDADMEEYRRLLYVALSRAEERLYIAGCHGERGPDGDCWANMINSALANVNGIEEVPAFWNSEESVLRLASKEKCAAASSDWCDEQAAVSQQVLPRWLRSPAPVERDSNASPSINPSSTLPLSGGVGKAHPGQARREAFRRGRLVHLLLQYLPEIASPQRRAAAAAFLSARAPHLDAAASQKLAQEVVAVIALPELASLFEPGSKPEVSLTGKIELKERTIEIAGRVDRVGENDKEVLAADYKTGMPCEADRTPAPYRMQLALYRAVLAPLWPRKALRMLVIWTEGPRVVWLPDSMLVADLAALAAD
jgi:ATP-dependent helicase/nuclease subunit A